MKPQDYIDRNIKNLLGVADKPEVFSASWVQRTCRIGYNQATHTLVEMERRGIITKASSLKWCWLD